MAIDTLNEVRSQLAKQSREISKIFCAVLSSDHRHWDGGGHFRLITSDITAMSINNNRKLVGGVSLQVVGEVL